MVNRGRALYELSEILSTRGVKVPRIMAYGRLRRGRKPFVFMKRVEGRSLFDLLIREGRSLPEEIWVNVLEEMIKIHRLGYWLGDAHLSHFFVTDSEVSGLIDIDSMRKNLFFSIRQPAKDLAGLNHPGLPLTEDQKELLLRHYLREVRISNEEKFRRFLRSYTRRRWQGKGPGGPAEGKRERAG